ncbi:MAG: histidine kinase, partial [Bacteroidetes bacterium]|nr:histidine kinase [Bacteroidota bacterium]
FLLNIKTIVLYSLMWVLISGIHFFLFRYYLNEELLTSLADILVYNTLFALLGIAVWYAIRYYEPKRSYWFNLLFNLLTVFTIIVLIWIGMGMLICSSFNVTYISSAEQVIPVRLLTGFYYFTSLVMVYYLFIYYQNLEAKMQDELKLQNSLRRVQLDSLKSQINPHFLFNCLNSISSYSLTYPEKAHELTVKFASYLRYNLALKDDTYTTAGQEFENIGRYLSIEKSRFGEKLEYELDIHENCLECQFPVMILQPLFENAVKHGVYENTSTVLIRCRCNAEEDGIVLEISNNYDTESRLAGGTGIGLANVRERLALLYPGTHVFQTTKAEGIFTVKLMIPVEKQINQSTIPN